MGLQLNDKSDFIRVMMYDAYQNGISPREFRRCAMRDIREIADLKSAFDEKNIREAEIRRTLASMRR